MKLGVFIGRFQPLHVGHMHVIRQAVTQVDRLLILVGSANEPRTTFNPWSYQEREDFILAALDESHIPDVVEIRPLNDSTYNNSAWVRDVQAAVAGHLEELDEGGAEVLLVGFKKDGTSFYLDMFPQWGSIAVEPFGSLSATELREKLFVEGEDLPEEKVPHSVDRAIGLWTERRRQEAYDLCQEFRAAAAYKAQFVGLRHPPTFITTDAVIVQSGHLLLIQRGRYPGKGLWALPGGFLEAKSRIEDNMLDEVEQETGIPVDREFLRHHIVRSRVFDAVYRSARGRTVTHAYLIHLPGGPLPPPRAGDDAADARWVPLSELNRSEMFEDHYAIASSLVATLDR